MEDNEWLDYYSQLRQYKDNLESRFISLVFKQVVVSFVAVTVVLTIHEKIHSSLSGFLVSSVAIAVLIFYYFLTGSIFVRPEELVSLWKKSRKKI